MPLLPIDQPSSLDLGMSGMLGFLSGDHALSAMVMAHIYGNKTWLGWYNNSGSFQLFRQIMAFTKSSPLSNGSSPSKGILMDPTKLYGLEGYRGPKYWAAQSGTVMQETGYVADLFMKEYAGWNSEEKVLSETKMQPVGITVVDIGQAPPIKMRLAQKNSSTILCGIVPIAVSIGACALSAVFEDWLAALLILVGIVASGMSSLVLGFADFVFTHPEPAEGSPAGDGILSSDEDIVLVRGSEGAVNAITRGKFALCFSSVTHLYLVRLCSYLFLFQAVVQLFLIPSASPFGQIMFLISLGVSALYNLWLATSNKEDIFQKFLFQRVFENLSLAKCTLGTRTVVVVFILLVLQPQNPAGLLDELLPDSTRVWKQWKMTVLERLGHSDDKSSFQFSSKSLDIDGFTHPEKDLLRLLYQDTEAAYNGYMDYLQGDAL